MHVIPTHSLSAMLLCVSLKLWSVFLIPAAGVFVTLVVLAGELVYYRKMYRGVVAYKGCGVCD